MNFLGIETSCDETAMAIIDENKKVLSHIVFSQIDLHKIYGGVVPELAARNHLTVIDKVFSLVLEETHLKAEDIYVIGATTGPGLIGGVLVGTLFAKSLSSMLNKPFIAVNHLEGHALMCRFTDNVEFPFLLLLLSGGHCQILEVNGVGKYRKIGETIDDALGETYDKVGKMLNIEYPAGPKIEQMAKQGNQEAYKFVCPLIDKKNGHKSEDKFNFSFSGLKTAIKLQIDAIENITEQVKCDICASFQHTVVKILTNRLVNVLESEEFNQNINTVVISGGVSANQFIKEELNKVCQQFRKTLVTPPIKLCTDNGLMIANVVMERYKLGKFSDLSITPLSRWELEDL